MSLETIGRSSSLERAATAGRVILNQIAGFPLQLDESACAQTKCQNKGVCVPMTEINSLGYKCICPPSYSGLFCETNMQQPYVQNVQNSAAERRKQADLDALICGEHQCGPNGMCININNKLAHCLCQEPYYGDKCQYRDGCYDNPCKPNEVCLQWPNNKFVCHDSGSSSPPYTRWPLSSSSSLSTTFSSTSTTTRMTTVTSKPTRPNLRKIKLNKSSSSSCDDKYCNNNGVCKVVKKTATDESLLACSCKPGKTGSRCEAG